MNGTIPPINGISWGLYIDDYGIPLIPIYPISGIVGHIEVLRGIEALRLSLNMCGRVFFHIEGP